MTELKLKRAYEPASDSDGYRVYIDRLWPQGLSHATFRYDAWDKGIAPSAGLRKWFHENRDGNWGVFAKKYTGELEGNPAWPLFVDELEKHPVVTLLYSSKNERENNAVIVYGMLLGKYAGLFEASVEQPVQQ